VRCSRERPRASDAPLESANATNSYRRVQWMAWDRARGDVGQAGARVSDIAETFGLNMSRAHGIITGLERHRYVERDEATKRYRLGLAIL